MAAYHRRAGQGAAPPLEIALAQRFMGDKQQPVIRWKCGRGEGLTRVDDDSLGGGAARRGALAALAVCRCACTACSQRLLEEPLCADASIVSS